MSEPEDNTMLESSSEDDEEAMFPPPSTFDQPSSSTHGGVALFENQPTGLSPPHSQELHDAMDTAEASHEMNGADQFMDAAQGIDQSNGNGGGWEPKTEFAKSAEMAQEPGSCWNNRKAKEEWQKAWSQVEDKNFNLNEFGDPFDESEGRQDYGN